MKARCCADHPMTRSRDRPIPVLPASTTSIQRAAAFPRLPRHAVDREAKIRNREHSRCESGESSHQSVPDLPDTLALAHLRVVANILQGTIRLSRADRAEPRAASHLRLRQDRKMPAVAPALPFFPPRVESLRGN